MNTWHDGATDAGSASDPANRSTMAGRRSVRWEIGEPHPPPKLRRTPGDDANSLGCPRVRRSADLGAITNVATGADV